MSALPIPDTSPFSGLSAWAVACVFGAHFLGFLIRGAFGFGSNLPIVLLTTWLLGPHHAILLVVLTASAAQLYLFPQGIGTADWRVARSLTAGMLIGIALGTWLFVNLAADWLSIVLGLLVVAIVVMDRCDLLRRLERVADLRSTRTATILAASSGTVGTVSGGGTLYFLAGYLKLACPTPQSLRGTNLIVSGLFMLARIPFVAAAGLLSLNLVMEAALLLPVVFLGTWAGTRAFHVSSAKHFYAGLHALLLCAALGLMIKNSLGFF